MSTNNQEMFYKLVRAGLWEKAVVNLHPDDNFDWDEVYRQAEEQSVIGLVLAGIEHSNVKPPQELLLQWIGEVQILEQQNRAMNGFIALLIEKLRNADIYTLLVKGQGVAQCYEHPLWRASGDIDLFLSEENFIKARKYLTPLVKAGFEPNDATARNISARISSWEIELHSNQFIGLSRNIDKGIKELQESVFCDGNVRSWTNGNTQVFLPGIDCDVLLIFTHFLKHFYKGGLGLRQICDWCRLLWTYKESLDLGLLESRIRKMGLMSEWKAFGAFAVEYLGMPVEAMPFYSSSRKWSRKGERIRDFVMRVGNMGHNRERGNTKSNPFVIRKLMSLRKRFVDTFNHAMIFPLDSIRFFPNIVFNGILLAAKGRG